MTSSGVDGQFFSTAINPYLAYIQFVIGEKFGLPFDSNKTGQPSVQCPRQVKTQTILMGPEGPLLTKEYNLHALF